MIFVQRGEDGRKGKMEKLLKCILNEGYIVNLPIISIKEILNYQKNK